jgi:hypothetical protein
VDHEFLDMLDAAGGFDSQPRSHGLVPLQDRFARTSYGVGGWRHASPFSRADLSGTRSIGELAVHRESLERVLMESPQSLQVILDALLDALRQEIAVDAEPVSLREAKREEEKELCAVSTEPEF